MTVVRFAGVQMSMRMDKEANLGKAETMIENAAKKYRPDIIGLPEFFNCEFSFPMRHVDPKYFEYAEPIPGPTTDRIARKAKEHCVYIVAPIYEKAGRGLYYNSSVVVAPTGEIMGVNRKIAPANNWVPQNGIAVNEAFYYSSGSGKHAYPVYRTSKATIGQLICYDRAFPENWRILTSKGADVIFCPIGSLGAHIGRRGEMFVCMLRALGYLFQCYVVAVNRVGTEEAPAGSRPMTFYGGSFISGPNGEVLAGPASNTEDEIICAELNLDEIDRIRQVQPFQRELHGVILREQLLERQRQELPEH